MVKSYRSNHKNWKETPPMERGAEPTLGIPSRYELTFYDQERKMSCLADSQIGLKLYNGKTWNWYYFQIRPSDAKQISRLSKTRKMLSPIVDKVRGRIRSVLHLKKFGNWFRMRINLLTGFLPLIWGSMPQHPGVSWRQMVLSMRKV